MPPKPSDPGDHPGYVFMQITANIATDNAAIEALEQQGYRFVAVISSTEILLSRGY
jgi:hypothetical protein